MTTSTSWYLEDRSANPGPLGLFGFGFSTLLLNLGNAGFIPLDSMILAIGFFYGGLAQVIAGILEAKKGNTFGLTAFGSYGFFWLSFVGLLVMPRMNLAPAVSASSLAAYLACWGLFTLILFFGTLRISRALMVVFATLVILFALLALGKGTSNDSLVHLAGYVGILCGASAIYTGGAQVLNETCGRNVLPMGQVARVRSAS